MAGIIGLHAGLFAVVFLYFLNGYLRGAKQVRISRFLMLAWLALVVVAFVIFGFWAGVLAILMSGAYVPVALRLAPLASRRILGYRTAFDIPTMFDGPELTIEGMMRRAERDERRLADIAAKPAIARVLAERGLTSADLAEAYRFLARSGLGELSWELVSNPKDLVRVLEVKGLGLKDVEVFAQLTKV